MGKLTLKEKYNIFNIFCYNFETHYSEELITDAQIQQYVLIKLRLKLLTKEIDEIMNTKSDLYLVKLIDKISLVENIENNILESYLYPC
jgi:hypothetical protein